MSTSATNLAGARLAAALRLLDDPAAAERLRHTAVTHLLAHDPDVLARQARLIEPLPRPGVVRVAVSPTEEAQHWAVDVACRDADGLLARLTDVLADAQLQIVRADIATWPDGGVVDSFVVRASTRSSARALAAAFEEALRRPLAAVEPVDVEFVVQQDALPWYSVCTMTAHDSPGLLRAVARAFASANVTVHSARLASQDGRVSHRFTVSDRFGRKLDENAVERIRLALANGAGKRRRR